MYRSGSRPVQIDHRRSIEEEKGKRKKKKKKKRKRRRRKGEEEIPRGSAASPCCPRATFLPAQGDGTSLARGRLFSLRKETELLSREERDRGDILQEVGENVADIVIFADGSWNSFVEHNESINQVHEGRSQQQDNSNPENQNNLAGVVDLTIAKSPEVGPFQNSAHTAENYGCEIEDKKPFRDDEGLPIPLYASGASVINTSLCTQAPAYYTESGIWPRNMSSVSSSESGRMVGANANALGTLASILPNVLLNPIHTDAVSPVLNRDPAGFELSHPTLNFQQVPQVTQLAENVQLEPLYEVSSINNNEAGRQVIRTPIAVQAFPAQTQIPSSSRTAQTGLLSFNSMVSNGYAAVLPNTFSINSCRRCTRFS
ncbi:hypothetical protein GW17_00061025 [Ensete ventricosum]|nr:hypothetical protein GW17_00061025 [Ensete ventricosum]